MNMHISIFLQAANYDFFQTLEKQCCATLEHHDLPVFQPSTADVRAGATLQASPAAPPAQPASPGSGKPPVERKESGLSLKTELGTVTPSLSLALSLGMKIKNRGFVGDI